MSQLVTDEILERYVALMETYGIPCEFWRRNVTVHCSSELYVALATEAERRGVSLNDLCAALLEIGIGDIRKSA